MIIDKAASLLAIAQAIAAESPEFQTVKGPGAGDRATHAFMHQLRTQATEAFGADYSEKRLCGDTALAADFYFPDEGTVVEVALGLHNPASEFEKDVLKAIMAQEYGSLVRRLFFISRAGGAKKCAQPGRSAIIRWAAAKHGLSVDIGELPGEPRKRARNRRTREVLSSGVV